MEVAHGQTEAGVGLEAARGREHQDGGGFEGVFGRELELAVVVACVQWVGGWVDEGLPFLDGCPQGLRLEHVA